MPKIRFIFVAKLVQVEELTCTGAQRAQSRCWGRPVWRSCCNRPRNIRCPRRRLRLSDAANKDFKSRDVVAACDALDYLQAVLMAGDISRNFVLVQHRLQPVNQARRCWASVSSRENRKVTNHHKIVSARHKYSVIIVGYKQVISNINIILRLSVDQLLLHPGPLLLGHGLVYGDSLRINPALDCGVHHHNAHCDVRGGERIIERVPIPWVGPVKFKVVLGV